MPASGKPGQLYMRCTNYLYTIFISAGGEYILGSEAPRKTGSE